MGENIKTARMTRWPITVCHVADCLKERPIAERRPTRLISLEQPAPSSTEKEFWSTGLTEIPSFDSNPWDFYEPFLTLSSGRRLVLCNDRTSVREIRGFNTTPPNEYPYSSIRHKNFVSVYETYLFEGEASGIIEYVGLSLEDLLQKSICFSEPEIAYIISQVLAGIRFIWSRKLAHVCLSTPNILLSINGEVKLGQSNDHTSTGMNSLRVLMLEMMRETVETLNSREGGWSAEAISFVEAISWASPYELSDHVFIARCSSSAKILTPLCILSRLDMSKVELDKEFQRRRSSICEQ
ncbi:hypothetical protein V494_02448 [Pseudogymnoascus sp. VKM F-4513 (FW-928)]|nr:hypothetical protein V494_02448 [Pseudogymnoascus sp. VKM F-4513 (FW-928)]